MWMTCVLGLGGARAEGSRQHVHSPPVCDAARNDASQASVGALRHLINLKVVSFSVCCRKCASGGKGGANYLTIVTAGAYRDALESLMQV